MILALIAFILVVALGGMWAMASYEGAHAQALQAQALITANQTTQVSVVGQTILSIVLAVLVLVILGGIFIGLFLLKRRQNQQIQVGRYPNGPRWQTGPNARWQQSGQFTGSSGPMLEMSPQDLLMQQQMMQQQIMTMWMMRQMGQPTEVAAMQVAAPIEPQTYEIQSGTPWWE